MIRRGIKYRRISTIVTLCAIPVSVMANNGGSVLPPLDMATVRAEACYSCATPAQNIDAALVIATTLADGGYVAVWQNRGDGRVYVRSYGLDGQPRGAQFPVDSDAEDGILPVIITQRDGGFVARWWRDGERYEQHFDANGTPQGDKTELK